MKTHTTAPKTVKITLKVNSQRKGDLYELFDNQHYLTCGIDAEIPPITQLCLWQFIRARRVEGAELDYLQVFELSGDKGVQKITHAQEQPAYQAEAVLLGVEPVVTAKIFVIDDGDHSTMMLAEEY